MNILKLHAKWRELQADNHLSISCCTCENAAFEGMLCFVENTLNYFNSVKFDDLLRASVVYLVDNEKEERLQYVGSFRREIEKVGARMEL